MPLIANKSGSTNYDNSLTDSFSSMPQLRKLFILLHCTKTHKISPKTTQKHTYKFVSLSRLRHGQNVEPNYWLYSRRLITTIGAANCLRGVWIDRSKRTNCWAGFPAHQMGPPILHRRDYNLSCFALCWIFEREKSEQTREIVCTWHALRSLALFVSSGQNRRERESVFGPSVVCLYDCLCHEIGVKFCCVVIVCGENGKETVNTKGE